MRPSAGFPELPEGAQGAEGRRGGDEDLEGLPGRGWGPALARGALRGPTAEFSAAFVAAGATEVGVARRAGRVEGAAGAGAGFFAHWGPFWSG